MLEKVSKGDLATLRSDAESELAEPGRWGTTFVLIQSWGSSRAEVAAPRALATVEHHLRGWRVPHSPRQ